MASHLGRAVRNSGKNVRRKVRDLAKDGFLILHKGNTTAALNPRMEREITEHIERDLGVGPGDSFAG